MNEKSGHRTLMVGLCGLAASGKGTLIRFMRKHSENNFSMEHVSTSDELKALHNSSVDAGSAKGHLAPDDIVCAILKKRWSGSTEQNIDVIFFDGAPRSLPQAKVMQNLAAHSDSRFILINISVSVEECVRRMKLKPDDRVGHEDDNDPAVIATRHELYKKNIAGIMECLVDLDIPCFTIDNSANDGGKKMCQEVLRHIIPHLPVAV